MWGRDGISTITVQKPLYHISRFCLYLFDFIRIQHLLVDLGQKLVVAEQRVLILADLDRAATKLSHHRQSKPFQIMPALCP